MKTLTDEQAELFRRLRPTVRPLYHAVANLTSELSDACEHKVGNHPGCPVCALYESARDAEMALAEAPEALDAALLNGPHPLAAQRGPTR